MRLGSTESVCFGVGVINIMAIVAVPVRDIEEAEQEFVADVVPS